jgi:hypothetical protein
LDRLYFFVYFVVLASTTIPPIHVHMEESTQIRLFTAASAVMERFLADDEAGAYAGFREPFRFSDSIGVFGNDVRAFRQFLVHLKASPAYDFKWKMRRYVGSDIEFALYFSRRDQQAGRKDPNVTIMAWVYMPRDGKATRLSLDYDAGQVIAELTRGRFALFLNRLRHRMGRYRVPETLPAS